MPTNFGWFILIFNKMALIFLGVLIVFTVSSFEFQQVRLPWLHRLWWVAPIHPTSIHWIIRFGGNARVLTKAAIEANTSSRDLKCASVFLVCVTGESHWQRCERLPQASADMCVSQWWTFWTFNVTINLTDTNCYTELNIIWRDLFFNEKLMNFLINEIELLKCEGLTSLNDTIQTNIQINGQKLV